eukprot:CAMPEP_0184734456 /NCGR_PEP_ID=MMETSP0314-20130426/60527_1 /TAXON_ID=38298 /ORGANISM="Rhodella maculata, Strain CCMP 736" /LENGTH=70 /DNA_ID=CAMNT_0027201405 /DNA_START=45 /DNA_END=253 /DNA_ORIENTATION=+
MGRFRTENTAVAFRNVYKTAGGGLPGVAAFWSGFTPKMVESASKGAVLLVAKEALLSATSEAGLSPTLAG